MSPPPESPLAVLESASSVAALVSPLRRRILEELHDQADSASGLARRLDIPRQKLNYHFRTLEREGLLELESVEKRRGCVERVFRASARAYLIRPDVLGSRGCNPDELQDRFSSAFLIALGARIVRDVAQLRKKADNASKRLATFALEVDVRFGSVADRTAFAQELTDSIARLAARYQNDSAESRPHRFVIGGYPLPTTQESKGEQTHGHKE